MANICIRTCPCKLCVYCKIAYTLHVCFYTSCSHAEVHIVLHYDNIYKRVEIYLGPQKLLMYWVHIQTQTHFKSLEFWTCVCITTSSHIRSFVHTCALRFASCVQPKSKCNHNIKIASIRNYSWMSFVLTASSVVVVFHKKTTLFS